MICVSKSSPSDFIATGFWNKCFFKSCQHWTGKHYRSAKPSAFFSEIFTVQVIKIYIIGLENAGITVDGLSIFTFISANNSINRFTSRISGILLIVTFSGVSNTALMICNASFFAPWGMISPFNFLPPELQKIHVV